MGKKKLRSKNVLKKSKCLVDGPDKTAKTCNKECHGKKVKFVKFNSHAKNMYTKKIR